MADAELTPSTIDVFLSSLSTIQSQRSGPLGRLLAAKNVRVLHRDPNASPPRIALSQRNGFTSYPTALRSSVDGTVSTPQWNSPQLLGALDDQTVSICNAIPRVWNGTSWTYYGATRTLTNKLTQDVLHTSQHTIQAPKGVWLGGVTCSAWTETVNAATGALTASYVSFKADNGAWVVTPTVLHASASVSVRAFAKAVTDGSHFFVFWLLDATHVNINCYDTNGVLLSQSGVAVGAAKAGCWDVVVSPTSAPNAGTVLFASVVSPTADSGVLFVSVGFASGAITTHANADTSVKGVQIAWITNDVNALAYLATLDSTADVWTYEVTALAQTNQFGPITSIATDEFSLDTFAGFAVGATGTTVVVSIGLLPALGSPPAHGPPVDPGLRFVTSWTCDRSNAVTILRSTQTLCQVTRAFKVDGEYYVGGYYQGGAGIGISPRQQAITITALSDYMIGAQVQAIAVQAGDSTQGSPVVIAANLVLKTNASSSLPVGPPDFVNTSTAGGGGSAFGLPAGTPILVWSFTGRLAQAGDVGSRLVVAGTSVLSANSTWDIVDVDSAGRYVTPLVNVAGTTATTPIGNFTSAGTFLLVSMTNYATNDLSPFINTATAGFFTGGGLATVTGSTHGNNISGVAIARVLYGQPGPNFASHGLWVVSGSQTTFLEAVTVALSPVIPNAWTFAQEEFDSTYIGTSLVVDSDPLLTSNVNTYPVTAVSNPTTLVTGGQTAITAQVFQAPLPTASILLTTQIAYTFFFDTITPDYTFLGALLTIQGSTTPANNGTYRVTQFDPVARTFVAYPTNGTTNQVNEALSPSQTATLFFPTDQAQPFQPTWFLVPLTGTQPVVGRWDSGVAYADWRIESDNVNGPSLFPLDLSEVTRNHVGLQFVLPYRAQNVTAGVTQATTAGQVNLVEEIEESTVGLKVFGLLDAPGVAYENSGELLIPGPMATVFTPSGFLEDNINLGLEAPFLVSQSVASAGTLALSLGATYEIVAVAEYTDENGARIFSIPSPALSFQMGGTNNVATYGGRLIFPLGTGGAPIAKAFGPTCRQVTISLYRTAFINGTPTTTRYKITDDLAPNALAPVSATNASGFAFPNSFTWEYTDSNPDSGLNGNEALYTDKGFLPRFPAPPFSFGVGSWKNREWSIGYDGAVWMSAERTEGDAPWFFTGFRVLLPTDDEPAAMAVLENSLIVLSAEGSIWQLPATTFPDATGKNGSLPTPVRLPFYVDCTGFAVSLDAAVAFSSNSRGPAVWMITRDLKLVWLTEAIKDLLTEPILGMSVDGDQLLHVVTASQWFVYDQVANVWTQYVLPTSVALVAQVGGKTAFQDADRAWQYDPDSFVDFDGTTATSIPPDVTLASINFGSVRGLKSVWEFQLCGTYKGQHRINIVVTYPDEYNEPPTTFGPFTPDPSEPYVIVFNPMIEEAASYGVRVFVDFVGVIDPGDSFEFELISCEVGSDRRTGLTKLPDSQTATGQ